MIEIKVVSTGIQKVSKGIQQARIFHLTMGPICHLFVIGFEITNYKIVLNLPLEI